MSNFNKVRFECQDVGVGEGECVWVALPRDPPIWTGSPPVAVHEEREITVVEEEFTIHTLYMNRLNVFFSRHEI
jgi:hypothetical protein